MSVRAAHASFDDHVLSLRSAYRLWRRFGHVQTTLRQKLSRKIPAPKCDSCVQEFAVIDHLKAAFPGSACPVSDYQGEFDIGFFAVPGPNL